MSTSDTSLWKIVKNDLKSRLPEDVFRHWLDPLACLHLDDTSITLGAPTEFATIWIRENYLDLITERMRFNSDRHYVVMVKKNPNAPVSATSRRNQKATPEERAQSASLNPRYTFENYVVGIHNEMAHAAALAVVQAPAKAYNPLFIHGSIGLGKTHLMHAIGHAFLRANPHAKIACLTAEKLTNEYVSAIKDNAISTFRRRYRDVGVLLLDDVQFLNGKEGIQKEFSDMFNELRHAGCQIVLACDHRTSEIKDVEARIVSRFELGLSAEIELPDFETRLKILRNEAVLLKCELSPDVLYYISKSISKKTRTLEGALLNVISTAFLNKAGSVDIDLNTAKRLLEPFFDQ